MKTVISEYDNHHNVLCFVPGCHTKAAWDVSNAVGDRVRACDDHVGDAAGGMAKHNREEVA